MKEETLFQKAWVLDANARVFPSDLYPYDLRNKPTAIDFASRRAIEEEKQKDSDESQLTIFFKTTSITALNQVQYTESFYLKGYWILLFLAGLAVSIFQSYLVISNFLKFGVLEKTRLTLQGNIEFPSVTICVNMPLKWDNATYHDDLVVKQFVDEMTRKFDMSKDNRYKSVINAMSSLDRKKRHRLGVQTKDFVIHCAARELDDDYRSCSQDLLDDNSLYFGNCATFNYKVKDADEAWLMTTDLDMAIRFYTTQEYVDPRRETSVILSIHQAGTAPLLKEALHISAGDYVEIDVFKKEFHRLPWPWTSECVDSDSYSNRARSLFFDNDHPYIYSMESCLDTCIQNLTMDYCNCFLSNYVLRKTPKRSMRECDTSCDAIPAHELTNLCKCRNPCQNFEYTMKVQRHPEAFYADDYMSSFLDRPMSEEEIDDFKSVGTAGFSISLSSQFVDVTDENSEEQALNMLGNIGGVFGLWIGISIMSVFEVLVSIYDGFIRCLCRRNNYKR